MKKYTDEEVKNMRPIDFMVYVVENYSHMAEGIIEKFESYSSDFGTKTRKDKIMSTLRAGSRLDYITDCEIVSANLIKIKELMALNYGTTKYNEKAFINNFVVNCILKKHGSNIMFALTNLPDLTRAFNKNTLMYASDEFDAGQDWISCNFIIAFSFLFYVLDEITENQETKELEKTNSPSLIEIIKEIELTKEQKLEIIKLLLEEQKEMK